MLRLNHPLKRLTKVLDIYYRTLVNQGKTEHIDRAIRNTQQMLIQEGNLCKEQWWQKQLQKVELADKSNQKFWRRIRILSGKKKLPTPPLNYKENNIEKHAKTDRDKTELFTNFLCLFLCLFVCCLFRENKKLQSHSHCNIQLDI